MFTDFLKGLAIIAVVLIHVYSGYTYKFNPPQSLGWNVTIIIDQLSRFCVPLFVALSGYGLAISFQKHFLANLPSKKLRLFDCLAPTTVWMFFQKRVIKLLPWFIFWSAVIYLFVTYVANQHNSMYTNLRIWDILLLGRADYHLYFVPMIFQLYLLFPFLYFLVKRLPRLSLLLAFIWQVGFYLFIAKVTESPNGSSWSDQQQYFTFLSWIFYFVLGIYFSRTPTNKRSPLYLPALITIVGLTLSIFDSFRISLSNTNIIVATRFTRLPILLYTSGLIVFFLAGYQTIESLLQKYVNKPYQMIAFLGVYSFQIYLCHTIFLRLAFDFWKLPSRLPEIVVVAIVLFLSLLTAYLTTQIANRLCVLIKFKITKPA